MKRFVFAKSMAAEICRVQLYKARPLALKRKRNEEPTEDKRDVWVAAITEDGETGYTLLTTTFGVQPGGKMREPNQRVYKSGKKNNTPTQQAVQECATLARDKIIKNAYLVDIVANRSWAPENDPVFAAIYDIIHNPPKPSQRDVPADSEPTEPTVEPPQVMLALSFDDYVSEFFSPQTLEGRFKFHVMPKLDGVFCLAHAKTGQLWSRARKPLGSNLTHISTAVKTLFDIVGSDSMWFVGELYTHGLTFQKITSLVRKYKSEKIADKKQKQLKLAKLNEPIVVRKSETSELSLVPAETEESAETEPTVIEYHIFDIMILDKSFSDRRAIVNKIVTYLENAPAAISAVIKVVPCHTLSPNTTMRDVQLWHKIYTAENYEGVMVHVEPMLPKEKIGYMSAKRTKYLLKYKTFSQDEFECLSIKPQERSSVQTGGSAVLKLTKDPSDNKTFSATLAMSHQDKADVWSNRDRYVGTMATVSFFGRTDDGVPRFPQLLGFRHPDDC